MTSRMQPRAGRRRHRPMAAAVAAVAIFAVACGLVLLFVPIHAGEPAPAPEPAAAAPPRPTAPSDTGPGDREQLLTGIDHAREARRALSDGNYRDARDHLARVEHSLTQLLASARSEPPTNPSAGRE